MTRFIKRRDPTRPGLWYLSYCHPHPPLVPLQPYLDMYNETTIDSPISGEWSSGNLTPSNISSSQQVRPANHWYVQAARKAFYALCTHIDHQLRVVIGALREENLLDNTIILLTGDHGDMLGNHSLWGKRVFYEYSANIPMILLAGPNVAACPRIGIDDRLVGLQDVMPTLLNMCSIDIPQSVEGISMVGNEKRPFLYGEIGNGPSATRMIHDGQFKLIYYPCGNSIQLFDIEHDPEELCDLGALASHREIVEKLTTQLRSELYGGDEDWVQGEKLIGISENPKKKQPDPGLSGQRGSHWPIAPSAGRS